MELFNVYKIVLLVPKEDGVIFHVAASTLEDAICKLRNSGEYGDIDSTELEIEDVLV